MFFEKALFATLGAIREAMGAKVVPECSQKGSKRDNFVGRVDFWKHWSYCSKTAIFEVLEVSGDDLKTFSELKAGKGAFERCLRIPFCRFCWIFEILRVPLGDHFESKFGTFFWFDLWLLFELLLGGGRRQGRTPLSSQNLSQNLEELETVAHQHALLPLRGVGGS